MFRGKTILVVDDNLINHRILKIILERNGASTQLASNGMEAIEILKNNPIDVILMDINMPVMDGFETTAYIRNVLKSNVLIIGLTADIIIENSLLLKAGMDAAISKPLEPNEFSNLLLELSNKKN